MNLIYDFNPRYKRTPSGFTFTRASDAWMYHNNWAGIATVQKYQQNEPQWGEDFIYMSAPIVPLVRETDLVKVGITEKDFYHLDGTVKKGYVNTNSISFPRLVASFSTSTLLPTLCVLVLEVMDPRLAISVGSLSSSDTWLARTDIDFSSESITPVLGNTSNNLIKLGYGPNGGLLYQINISFLSDRESTIFCLAPVASQLEFMLHSLNVTNNFGENSFVLEGSKAEDNLVSTISGLGNTTILIDAERISTGGNIQCLWQVDKDSDSYLEYLMLGCSGSNLILYNGQIPVKFLGTLENKRFKLALNIDVSTGTLRWVLDGGTVNSSTLNMNYSIFTRERIGKRKGSFTNWNGKIYRVIRYSGLMSDTMMKEWTKNNYKPIYYAVGSYYPNFNLDVTKNNSSGYIEIPITISNNRHCPDSGFSRTTLWTEDGRTYGFAGTKQNEITVEGARRVANLLRYTSDFSNAVWEKFHTYTLLENNTVLRIVNNNPQLNQFWLRTQVDYPNYYFNGKQIYITAEVRLVQAESNKKITMEVGVSNSGSNYVYGNGGWVPVSSTSWTRVRTPNIVFNQNGANHNRLHFSINTFWDVSLGDLPQYGIEVRNIMVCETLDGTNLYTNEYVDSEKDYGFGCNGVIWSATSSDLIWDSTTRVVTQKPEDRFEILNINGLIPQPPAVGLSESPNLRNLGSEKKVNCVVSDNQVYFAGNSGSNIAASGTGEHYIICYLTGSGPYHAQAVIRKTGSAVPVLHAYGSGWYSTIRFSSDMKTITEQTFSGCSGKVSVKPLGNNCYWINHHIWGCSGAGSQYRLMVAQSNGTTTYTASGEDFDCVGFNVCLKEHAGNPLLGQVSTSRQDSNYYRTGYFYLHNNYTMGVEFNYDVPTPMNIWSTVGISWETADLKFIDGDDRYVTILGATQNFSKTSIPKGIHYAVSHVKNDQCSAFFDREILGQDVPNGGPRHYTTGAVTVGGYYSYEIGPVGVRKIKLYNNTNLTSTDAANLVITDWRGIQPDIDLWLGGPKATGKGLGQINGGPDRAPGLVISSPSFSTPSSTARFLIKDSDSVWRDKQKDQLLGIQGRVWTGTGRTYQGASNVLFKGPMPSLSTHGRTDTVRCYSVISGLLDVSDAVGGIIQPYSQKCEVLVSGQSGGGWGIWAPQVISIVENGTNIYWHAIVETSTPEYFEPVFGAYADSSFFDGIGTIGNLSLTGSGSSGVFRWKKRHLGTGPNGGTLVEIFVSQTLTQSRTSVGIPAYLLRSEYSGYPARTLYIHNYNAYAINAPTTLITDWPSWMLVAAGSAASLISENISVIVPSFPCTVLMRVDLSYMPNPLPYISGNFANFDGWNSAFYSSDTRLRWWPPDISTSSNTLSNSLITIGFMVDSSNRIGFIKDGIIILSPTVQASYPLTNTLNIGKIDNNTHHLHPIHRVQIWSRLLTASEIAEAHASMVAAEN